MRTKKLHNVLCSFLMPIFIGNRFPGVFSLYASRQEGRVPRHTSPCCVVLQNAASLVKIDKRTTKIQGFPVQKFGKSVQRIFVAFEKYVCYY